jgi:hypothetical protein
VSRLTAVYLDFQDRSCYRVWRWLSLLPERAVIDIRPFSVDAGRSWDRRSETSGLELLALGELARETSREAHHRFVDVAFSAVHDQGGQLTATETWLKLGVEAGLDLEQFTADSERWRAEVGLWQAEAEDEFAIREVPALVFDGRLALVVRLSTEIHEAAKARRLLDRLAALADQPIASVRRTT